MEGGALLVVDKTARYFVADGSRIVVQPEEGASSRNVRLFLLGSAFGLLLHQRGLLPLHANAVEIDGRAVAFAGGPGAGKSTLAAWFSDRGFALIADDVAVIDFEGKTPIIQPGLPRLRLWERAIERPAAIRRTIPSRSREMPPTTSATSSSPAQRSPANRDGSARSSSSAERVR